MAGPGVNNPTYPDNYANFASDYSDPIWRKKLIDQAVANGTILGGSQQYNTGNDVQSETVGAESDAERQAEEAHNFQLGVNNSDQANALVNNAQSIAAKYGSLFGNNASAATNAFYGAKTRGTGMYAGDTSAYGAAQANAGQDRALQTGAYGALLNFANQGPGPSAAQAQLQQATNANTANALALARSGTGMGGSAAGLRQAIAQNAVTQQGANAQAAELRANENTAFQAQRLGALGQAGGLAGQVVQGDQGTAQTGLAGAQYQTNTRLQGTQLNDQTALGFLGAGNSALSGGTGAELGGQQQALSVDNAALAGRSNYEQTLNQGHAIDVGASTQAGIADKIQQGNYIGAGVSAGAGLVNYLDKAASSNDDSSSTTSDVRAKKNIIPLDRAEGAPPIRVRDQNNPSRYVSPFEPISRASRDATEKGPAGFWDYLSNLNSTKGGDSRYRAELNNPTLEKHDPYEQFFARYPDAPVASSSKAVEQYASAPAPRVGGQQYARFARDDSHPILSEGDSLLANSARNTPGSIYQYKDPATDGQGSFVGPMAQDVARDPLARQAVVQQQNGKLGLDGARLSTFNTAVNHSQQNQLDALDSKIEELRSFLSNGSSEYPNPKAPDAQGPTSYNDDGSDGGSGMDNEAPSRPSQSDAAGPSWWDRLWREPERPLIRRPQFRPGSFLDSISGRG